MGGWNDNYELPTVFYERKVEARDPKIGMEDFIVGKNEVAIRLVTVILQLPGSSADPKVTDLIDAIVDQHLELAW